MNQFGRAAPYIALFSEVGLALALPMLVGVFLGNGLDRSVGTGSIFGLAGLFAGMVLGGFASYRLVMRFLARFPADPPLPRHGGDRAADGEE